ncbi:hypothetical protein QUF84_21870 [Fictibacillus enclensis]|uniref:hypothetical protein n=1 Tax=Fictibacillus enclensis TaxID=1017270 RepID=UPI0024C03973|nr:hypothetical protein [Fictibacillus enclensis]MDM5339847.1 hypothetical protein [Fictibacillus enclensis]WHY71383.1 hypothetical protein QNH15_20580 [Fictibacillus enclensis]
MSRYLVDHHMLVIHQTAYICQSCQHHLIVTDHRDFTNSEEKVKALVNDQEYTYCPNCTQKLIPPPFH